MVILKIIPQLPNLASNFEKKAKKGPLSLVFLKHLTFGMILKKSCENGKFENLTPTPQLDIEFWNP